MKKRYLLLMLVLLAIGFASTATYIIINSSILIGTKKIAFEDGVVFSDALVESDKGIANIIDDGKKIVFSSNGISEVGDTVVVSFEIANKSTLYDANAVINCISSDKSNKFNEYIEIKTNQNVFEIPAGKKNGDGRIITTLLKPTLEEGTIDIECTIDATAFERTENKEYISNETYDIASLSKDNTTGLYSMSNLNSVNDEQIFASSSIFVSTSGSDENGNGTEENPYGTISKAISNATNGDTIYLRSGTYNETIVINQSGEENHPITLRNYPGETVTISAENLENNNSIILIDADYINIIGLNIENINEFNKGDAAYGIKVMGGSNNIIIQDCIFRNINGTVDGEYYGNSSPIVLWGNSVEPISNVLIYNNEISDCYTGTSEGIAVNGNSQYVDIINNRIHDITNIGIDVSGNYGLCPEENLDHARNVYVANNTVYNCVSEIAVSAGIYVDGGSDVLIERNELYGNGAGISVGEENEVRNSSYFAKNVIIANNLIHDNLSVQLSIGAFQPFKCGVKYVKIINNTILHPSSSTNVAVMVQKGYGYDFINNIIADYGTWNYLIYSNGFTTSDVHDVTFKNNILYSSNYNWFVDKKYIEFGGSSYTSIEFEKRVFNRNNIYEVNPLLTENYKLSNDSIGIGKGTSNTNINRYLTFDGNTHNNPIDLGCYKYTE